MSGFVQGIIHVHSDFSSDGLHSVADLADFARQSGFRFVGLTDHAEDLSDQDIQSLQHECKRCSDASFAMIPGLEFRCQEDVHILGVGVTENIASTDPVMVARHIQGLGGLAVIAHPGRNGYQYPRDLYLVLNGIEIWNAGYDGPFVPPTANLRLLQEARAMNPAVLGFGGADLHSLDRTAGVMLQLRHNGSESISKETILEDLRTGGFSIRGRYVSFDANPGCHCLSKVYLWAFRKIYETSTGIRNGVLGES